MPHRYRLLESSLGRFELKSAHMIGSRRKDFPSLTCRSLLRQILTTSQPKNAAYCSICAPCRKTSSFPNLRVSLLGRTRCQSTLPFTYVDCELGRPYTMNTSFVSLATRHDYAMQSLVALSATHLASICKSAALHRIALDHRGNAFSLVRLLGRSSKRIPTLCLQHLLSFLGKCRVGRLGLA